MTIGTFKGIDIEYSNNAVEVMNQLAVILECEEVENILEKAKDLMRKLKYFEQFRMTIGDLKGREDLMGKTFYVHEDFPAKGFLGKMDGISERSVLIGNTTFEFDNEYESAQTCDLIGEVPFIGK